MTAPPGADRPSVLVVDDEEPLRERLVRAFRDRGHDARGAASAAEACAWAQIESPEWAVVDLRLPDGSGLGLVRALHALDPTTRIVVYTGYGSIPTALDAMRAGAVHYLTKPASFGELLAAFTSEASPPGRGGGADGLPFVVPSLDRVEWEHIERVLASCQGNITQAAALLGIHRRSLQRKIARRPPRR
jgi:two-component system response regulator RegA